jgi:hypothetical protein
MTAGCASSACATRRRLYLSESGDDLRGEDVLEPEREVQVPGFSVRFHLHPAVVASLQQDEAGVLLRLPSGAGWRLRGKSARVTIEESIYLAGEPRRSQQVVLHAEQGATSVQWAISRVTMPGAGDPPAGDDAPAGEQGSRAARRPRAQRDRRGWRSSASARSQGPGGAARRLRAGHEDPRGHQRRFLAAPLPAAPDARAARPRA